MIRRLGLRTIAIGYLALLLLIPLYLVFERALRHGLAPVWHALSTPDAVHALWMTLITVGIAVPVNTVFGIGLALVLARRQFRGKWLVEGMVDLPFAVSPVVIGLALVLVYSIHGGLGQPLAKAGIQVIFSTPGMVLAVMFVSLPFVVRELVPLLRELGTEQEQAAHTLGASPWQAFWRITLPAIRWGLAYGVVLSTARALGEYGALSVVSGRVEGRTQTLTLFVEDKYQSFDLTGAYAVALLLAVMALSTLAVAVIANRRMEVT